MERRIDDIEETLPRPAARSAAPRPSSSAVLFLALFCDAPREPPSRHSLGELNDVTLGRGKSRLAQRDPARGSLELLWPDPWASAQHARLIRVGSTWQIEDLRSRNGLKVNGRSVELARLQDGDLIELGHTLAYFRQAAPGGLGAGAPDVVAAVGGEGVGFATLCSELGLELEKARQLGAAELPLLIQGESGTGKEVLARALAGRSARSGPFVGVNCGAIPPSLVESELFGHAKGAFTGADAHYEGLIRSAHRGTLFLDEIGDLESSAQAVLLRVLEERVVRPVGSTRAVPVDVRVLSATHRDLDAMVARGAFRADLLSRLSGFRLRLLPLRQRREDIGLIIASLLEARADELGADLRFEPEAARRLFRYEWPLNIRELENCLRAASVLASGGVIREEHLAEPLRQAAPGSQRTPPELDAAERQHKEQLIALFRTHRGNVSAVARELGKARTQVQRWVKRYRLDPREYQE